MASMKSLWQRLRVHPHLVTEQSVPLVELPVILRRFVDVVTTATDDNDPRVVAVREDLRRDAQALVSEVNDLLRAHALEDPALGRLASWALGETASTQAVDVLAAIAARPIGPAEGESGAAVDTLTVKTTAIEGLERLGHAGVTSVVPALVDLVSRDATLTVRGLALVALRDLDADAFARAAATLGEGDRYLADLYRTEIANVPQVSDPRKHLRRPAGPPAARPDPEGRETPGPGEPGTPRARHDQKGATGG